MTNHEVTSKMHHHADMATEAWQNGNLFDYHIENARWELALKTSQRRDREAEALRNLMNFARSL